LDDQFLRSQAASPDYSASSQSYHYTCDGSEGGASTCSQSYVAAQCGGFFPIPDASASVDAISAWVAANANCHRIKQVHFFNRRRYVILRVCKLSTDEALHYVRGVTFTVTCFCPPGTPSCASFDYSAINTDYPIPDDAQNSGATFQTRTLDSALGCTSCLTPVPIHTVCNITEKIAPPLWCGQDGTTTRSLDTPHVNYFNCDATTKLPISPLGAGSASNCEGTDFTVVNVLDIPRTVCTKLVKCAQKEECFVVAPTPTLTEIQQTILPGYAHSGPYPKVCSSTVQGCRLGGVEFYYQCWVPDWSQGPDVFRNITLSDAAQEAAFVAAGGVFPMHASDFVVSAFEKLYTTASGSSFHVSTSDSTGEAAIDQLPFGARCLFNETVPHVGYQPLGFRFWSNRLASCHVCTLQCPQWPYQLPASCAHSPSVSALERLASLKSEVL